MVLEFIQPIILIIIMMAFVAIVNVWIIGSADRTFFELLVKQPRFVDGPDATISDYSFQGFTSKDGQNRLLATYNSLRYISIFLIAMAVVIGMMVFLGEQFGIQKKGQALDIISNSFFYILLMMFFPLLWDTVAAGVESLNIYILNPGNPTPEAAAARAKDLFSKLGGIDTGASDWAGILADIGKAMIGDTSKITQLFHDLMTSVFRAFMSAMIFLMMFIVGTMRIVMTATIIAGLPVILAIKLVPWIRKPADRLLDTLYGLVVATIISSIVVVAGTAYLDTMPKDTLEQNFQATVAAMGVVMLAVLMPVMLSPMLGSIITSVTGMATTALAAGVTAAGAGIAGAARGATAVLGGGGGAGQAMAAAAMVGGGPGAGGGGGFGATLAKAAMSGMGGVGAAGRAMARSFGDFAGQMSPGAAASAAASMARPSVRQQPGISSERDVGVLSTTGIRPDIAPAKAYDYKGSAPISYESPTLPKSEPRVPHDDNMIRPVVKGTDGVRPDYSTLDDSVARGIELGDQTAMKKGSVPVLPGTSIYQPEPSPMAAHKKLAQVAKGVAIGGAVGLTQGLMKGNAMIPSSFGMGELKTAGKQVFDWLDLNNDGKLNVEDLDVGWDRAKQAIKDAREKVHVVMESLVKKQQTFENESTPDSKKWKGEIDE